MYCKGKKNTHENSNNAMIETLNQPSKFKNKILNTLHDVEIKIQAILTVSHKQQEEKEIAAMKEKPLLFYKYAAKYSITKSNICHLIDEERQSVPEPKKKQESLGYNMKVFSVNRIWRKRSKPISFIPM